MWKSTIFLTVFIVVIFSRKGSCEKQSSETQKPPKKKDIRDYNEADLEKLYEQWEKDDEPLEEDELPEWKRPPPKVDFSKMDTSNPESLLKAAKKGRTLMVFVSVTDDPSPEELERVTQLWQSSLFNAHIDTQRFIIDSNRAIFMFTDGAAAWDAKKYFLEQDRCLEVSIEGKSFPGKHSGKTEL